MTQPWYRTVFSGSAVLSHQSIRTKADEGDPNAQFHLGLTCATGNGHTPDYAEALQWYLKAGEQNHAVAQCNLGIMFSRAQGVPRDTVQAMVWFNKAAEQGDAAAQYNLGLEHHRMSFNEPPDSRDSRIEAYKWLQLAAGQQYHNAQAACERVAIRMSHDEVSEANKRIATFLAVKRPGAPEITTSENKGGNS